MRALTTCELCTLKKKDFGELIIEFPDIKGIFESAIKRLSNMRECNSIVIFNEGKLHTSVPAPNIQVEVKQ